MPQGLQWLPGDFLYILCKIYNLSIAFMILDNPNYSSPNTPSEEFFSWHEIDALVKFAP